MFNSANHRGLKNPLAPAAVLLLALCLLAGGAQAADTPRYVVGDVLAIDFAGSGANVVVGSVDTTSLAEPYYHTFLVEQNGGRWEITQYWHGDLALPEHVLVESEHAHRVAHVDPVKVIITDSTITGGFMLYYGLSLAEVRAGVLYPVEPEPGSVDSFPPSYIVGDILGNVSDPDRGSVVSSVDEQDGRAWFRVYFDAVRSGDRWTLDKFYNDDMAFPASALGQTGMRRVAHADPHTVIINDTTTNTGEIGWYRLSLAEFLAGKSYDGMGPWHFNTGDILSNGTTTRYIVGSATISYEGPSHYTLYEVVRGADGWTIPAWVDAGIPSETGLAQPDGTGFDLVDHTDPHFAVVTDPAAKNGLTFNGLSLGEILEGTPGYPPETAGPIGGDVGYFQVSTVPAGADIYLEDISGARTLQGNTSAGPLNVTVRLTATPVRAFVANLTGYRDAVYNVTQYPEQGQTLPVTLTLEPRSTPRPTDAPGPYGLHIIPGRVQAEDYDFYIFGGEGVTYHDTTPGNAGGAYRHDDVDIETGNGITDVGWIRNGEYLTYTVDVATTGDYAVAARVATPNPGCWIRFSVDGEPGTVLSLPRTGSFDTYTTATRVYYTGSPHYPLDPPVTATPMPTMTGAPASEHPLRLTAGTHVLKLEFTGDGQNLDWFELTPYVEPTTPPTVGPYRNVTLPGTIQAEDYDLGGEGVAYHDTTPANEGGAYRHDGVDIETGNGITNVGWIRNGEWMTYTANVTTAGTYTMTARVASPNTGRIMALIVDKSYLASIEVPNTGSFATFRTVDVPVTFAAGQHTIKLSFFGDGLNIDSISFARAAPTPEPYANVTLPATIQAEDYDAGGEGVAYHDTTPGNTGGAYRADGVDVATIPGGHAVVGIEDGEWLVYTIGGVSPTSQLPALVLYLGSDRDGGSVQLEVNGRAAGNVSVPNTGSPTAFRAVQTQVVAAPGTLRLLFRGVGLGLDRIESPVLVATGDAYATPNFTADPVNGTAPLTVRFTDTSSEFAYEWRWDFGDGTGSTEQNPVHVFQRPGVFNVSLTIKESDRWSGGAYLHIWNDPSHRKVAQVTVEGTGPAPGHAIPGTIQAEDYDAGGEGAGYHDTTAGNTGGAYRHDDVDIETQGGVTNVGWIRTGEWLRYTVISPVAGQYLVRASVASPNTGRTIAVALDGVPVATIAVPNTGSFGRFATVAVPIQLPAGPHAVRLTFAGDGQNLDWIAVGTEPVITPTPTPTPVPSGGASFTAVPATAAHGSAVRFTVTSAAGKSIRSAWWSFDAPAHLSTWNSRAINPTFFYPAKGTFSPLVKLIYTDGSTETVQRTGSITAT